MPRWKKEAAIAAREKPTRSEQILWAQLMARQLAGLKFRRQEPMLGYIADFYCPKVKLVVEVDGASHLARADTDARRDDHMKARGLNVLRLDANLVETDLPQALTLIQRAAGVVQLPS